MEDNDLYVTGTVQTPQPKIDDTSIVELAQKRKILADQKRKAFKRMMRVVYALLALIVAVFVGMFAYKSMIKVAPSNYSVTPPKPVEVAKPTTPDPTKPDNWTLYKSDKLKVFIRKPNNATTLEDKDGAVKVEVVYDKNNQNPTSGLENNLSEGYIFRVTPLNIGVRDIDSITKIKMDSFKIKCPTTAEFSIARSALVDTIDARTFEIIKCDADYVISYIPRFGIYYEIAEIYKGDFGYKQKYRATLDEMLRAFKFFPEKEQAVGPFKTFVDERTRIIFTHPNLDETCCDLPAPPTQGLSTIVMLGDKNTYVDKENFDGVGVFDSYYSGPNFDQFITDQKRLLTEDYKVVKSVDPVTTVTETKLGKYRAVRLSGYSWRGNDLIYGYPGGQWGNRIVILSVKNKSGASFENAVQQILSTFELY